MLCPHNCSQYSGPRYWAAGKPYQKIHLSETASLPFPVLSSPLEYNQPCSCPPCQRDQKAPAITRTWQKVKSTSNMLQKEIMYRKHPQPRNLLPVALASHGPTCRHSQTACELLQILGSEGQLSSKPPVHTKVVPLTSQDVTMIYSKNAGTVDEVESYECFKHVVWFRKYQKNWQKKGHAQNEQLE